MRAILVRSMADILALAPVPKSRQGGARCPHVEHLQVERQGQPHAIPHN